MTPGDSLEKRLESIDRLCKIADRMKVHLIFNAHIDPIWLWPWQAGVDEVLATCRSACDRLDAHPDMKFSRGEAWVYHQVERLDPALFRRITKFIKQGRWEIVGGWWIQPDCNAPSGFALEHQIDQGKRYFLDRFGQFPAVGYNVDSFGHAATLPGYLRAAGQRYYVMMRPQEHEMELPARLFRWRGYEGGPEVITFRIARAYQLREMNENHLRAATQGLPDGIDDTMCFVGVGNHGGGPTERQIAWLRQHWDAFPGLTLEFSTPARYFQAITRRARKLPLVTGELQMHAIGCYTVHRAVKTSLRRAEHLLDAADRLRAKLPAAARRDLPALQDHWRCVAFHQFHDTLGGTCLPSAYPAVLDQLGGVSAAADEILQIGFRRILSSQGWDQLQRIGIYNPSRLDFDGYAEFEPWRDSLQFTEKNYLLDEKNRKIPCQRIQREAVVTHPLSRIIFPVRVAAGQTAILRIAETGTPPAHHPDVQASGTTLRNNRGISVDAASGWQLEFGQTRLKPILQLVNDRSDTWSHGLDRYGDAAADAVWKKPVVIENGPLRAALTQTGCIGQSRLQAEWRVYANIDCAELFLQVFWMEKHKVLKLTLPLPASAAQERTDGILGGELVRPQNGHELPLRDWTQITTRDGVLGVVTPDVYALDGDAKALRFTLLRSPLLAHHDPQPPQHPRGVVADQGSHSFRFRFYFGKADPARLEREARMFMQPLLFADVTLGMPTRFAL